MLHDLILEAAVPLVSLRFVEEINHRVANEFAEAISALSHAAARAPCGDSREALDRAAARLLAHADLHRALLHPSAAGAVNLADHLARICTAFSSAVLADGGIRIHMKTDNVHLPAARCWRIGLIVAELVRNAARHGLSGKAGLILVEVRERGGCVTCLVCDNGRSAPKPMPGRGQALVRFLARELGGIADWWFTDKGTMARVDVPAGEAEGPARAAGAGGDTLV